MPTETCFNFNNNQLREFMYTWVFVLLAEGCKKFEILQTSSSTKTTPTSPSRHTAICSSNIWIRVLQSNRVLFSDELLHTRCKETRIENDFRWGVLVQPSSIPCRIFSDYDGKNNNWSLLRISRPSCRPAECVAVCRKVPIYSIYQRRFWLMPDQGWGSLETV